MSAAAKVLHPFDAFELRKLYRALTLGDRKSNAVVLLSSKKAAWLKYGFKERTATWADKNPANRLSNEELVLHRIWEFAEKYGETPELETLRNLVATTEMSNDAVRSLVDSLSEIPSAFDTTTISFLIDEAFEQEHNQAKTFIYQQAAQMVGVPGKNPEALIAKYLARDYVEAPSSVGRVLASGIVIDADDVSQSVSLVGTPVTEIEMLPTNWLWEDKIPAGFICWWAGKGGCGKTTCLIDLMARVSSGREFPDGRANTLGPKKVLFGSSEDDWSRT